MAYWFYQLFWSLDGLFLLNAGYYIILIGSILLLGYIAIDKILAR